MKYLVGRIFLILGLLLTPCLGFAQAQQEEILIGLLPEINVFKQMERFSSLAEYLTEQTGIKVKFEVLGRYIDFIDKFIDQRVDGAFFGSFTGAVAIQELGVIPIARPVNLDGESTYCGYIYTRKDSGIKGIADMEGKRFAFVEKATTAGYIFPLKYLNEHEISDINTFFSGYSFEERHDSAVRAVLYKLADVGASKNTVFDLERNKNPRIAREIVILAESSRVPSNGLCVRKNLDGIIVEKLKEALLNLDKSPEGKAVLKKLGAMRFIKTTVDDYNPVLDMVEEARIDMEKFDYK